MSRLVGLTDNVGRRGGQQRANQQQSKGTKQPRTTLPKEEVRSAYFISRNPSQAPQSGSKDTLYYCPVFELSSTVCTRNGGFFLRIAIGTYIVHHHLLRERC